MVGLLNDGDVRRIYEVPDNSSFTVDGNGFRRYVPNDIPAAATSVTITTTEMWSRHLDYREANAWSTVAFRKSGGALRGLDGNGFSVFAEFDLFFQDGWEFVPADYPHTVQVIGNVFGDEITGRDFDTDRITSPGVIVRVREASSGQTTLVDTAGGGADLAADVAFIRDILTDVQPGLSVRDYFRLSAAVLFGEVEPSGQDLVFWDMAKQVQRVVSQGDRAGRRQILTRNAG